MMAVPKIRFKGFAEDWERRKLGEVGEFKNGMNFGKEAMGHGYPFINLQDIFGKTVVDNNRLGLAESTAKQRQEYCLKKGDILFVRSSVKPEGVGETALVADDFLDTTYSGFIIRFRPNITIDNQFKRFAFITQSIRNQIMTKATSSANTNINQDALKLIEFDFPKKGEQEKIGNFFRTLDDFITMHMRKLDGLKELKKAYLQQMFPQAGERVPRVRFAGFSGDWMERPLKDLITPVVREVPKPETSYVRLSVRSHAKGAFHQVVDDPSTIAMDKLYVVKVNDLIVNITFAWEHAIAVAGIDDDGLLVSHRFPTFLIDKSDVYFIRQSVSFESFRYKLDLISPGGAGRNRVLNKNDFLLLKINAPQTIKEQTAIGSFFRSLDEQIVTQQTKLDKLKQLKAAYLQNMFV